MIELLIAGHFASGLWAFWYLLKHRTPKITVGEIVAGIFVILLGYGTGISVFFLEVFPGWQKWEAKNPFYKGNEK